MTALRFRFFCVLLTGGLAGTACDSKKELVDREVEAWQTSLLELAYSGSSKFPLNPHIKNRSKAQALVFDAALELGQGALAERFARGIANWRRGAAFADLARFCVENGKMGDIETYLGLAREVTASAVKEGAGQEWRSDRILAKVAAVYRLLGEDAKAVEFGAKIQASEQVHLAKAHAKTVSEAAFKDELVRIQAAIAGGDFESIRAGLATGVHLYDRFYGQADKRSEVRALVANGYDKLPLDIRIDLLLQLSDAALRHQDKGEAAEIVKSVLQILQRGVWLPENEVPMRARIVEAMHRSGDEARARAELESNEKLYLDKLDTIVNIYRASCLRAIAEAWTVLGDRERALAAYKRCVEAGLENPNSRPRADDFAATCSSLATHRFQPDDALLARLREVHDGLGEPW